MLKKFYSLILIGTLFTGIVVFAQDTPPVVAPPPPDNIYPAEPAGNPKFYTLSDIYNKISSSVFSGASEGEHPFSPEGDPSAGGTFVTLTQIWEAISWKTLTNSGSMEAGFYATSSLQTAEPNLIASNIAEGQTVLGVVGTCILPLFTDPCDGTPIIGTTCAGGALYAGEYGDSKYMIISSDAGVMTWSEENIITGATDTGDGETNTSVLAGLSGIYPAADYCAGLAYGDYMDWFLPAKDQLSYLFTVKDSLNMHTGYWSSSEYSGGAWMRYFQLVDVSDPHGKQSTHNVRCVRKF